VCLERFAFDPKLSAVVGDCQIGFSGSVVVVCFVNFFKNGVRKVHLAQFVFRNVTQHQTTHTGIFPDDFRQFLLR
jgi:hypothetical protein